MFICIRIVICFNNNKSANLKLLFDFLKISKKRRNCTLLLAEKSITLNLLKTVKIALYDPLHVSIPPEAFPK